MKKITILSLVIILVLSAGTESKTLWKDRNVYSTSQSLNVGDIIVIKVDDISRLQFTLDMNERKTSSVSSVPDMTITGFLPAINSTRTITGRDSSEVSSRGRLNLEISSVITGTRQDKYLLQGSRTYVFNGTTNRVTVSGVLDPLLVKGRTVDSTNIAEFRLTFDSLREGGMALTRPPVEEGKAANASLTEDEKQRIIIDYLQKMLREIMR